MPYVRDELQGAQQVEVVAGGDTRQESVRNGLDRVETPVVLVHDAARPFVEPDVVHATLHALADADAAVPAVPIDETVKHLEGTRVVHTVDRSSLALAQTPQAFKTEVLKRAHARARAQGFVATDDAQLVESFGGVVATVRGSRRNIKVTYPEDFAFAEALMRS